LSTILGAADTTWGLGPVDRRSTTDQVLHELRTAILAGRIKPQQQLPEAALARTMGTGRSAIREAIRHLVQEGLVVSEHNRGARVRPISIDDVIDVYRARTAIEVAATSALPGPGPELDVAPLRRAQERIRVHSSDQAEIPSRDLIAADLDFHRALVAMAGSPRLSRAHEPLAAESQMLLNWHPAYSVFDYVADHQTLLDAITAKGPDAAVEVRAHLELSVELIEQEARRYASRLASVDSLIHIDGHNEGEQP
jgi:DNA-binding GntR family transcriptional regulator